LKLPTTVREVFTDWLRRNYPDRADKFESLIRSTRAGRMHDSQFGRRQVGTGQIAELIASTFDLWTRKLGFNQEHGQLNAADFIPPPPSSGQLRLF
jgi:hypothetical protein